MITTVIINPLKQDRDRISSLLLGSGGIEILAYGKDSYDALKLTGNLKPDIAVIDNRLDFIIAEEIPPLIKMRSPLTAVIILAAEISDEQIFSAVSSGVSGFVHKKTDIETLPGILECVHRGGCFISPALAGRILHLFSAKLYGNKKANSGLSIQRDPAGFLSKTQLGILTCIGEGYTSQEIAENLGLAVGTVRNNISALMYKTGLRSRLEMARYAILSGLVPLNRERRIEEPLYRPRFTSSSGTDKTDFAKGQAGNTGNLSYFEEQLKI